MAEAPRFGFGPITAPAKGVLMVFAGAERRFGAATRAILAPAGDLISRAAASDRFAGKHGSVLDILAPAALKVGRLIVIGIANATDQVEAVKLGGLVMSKVPAGAAEATVLLDLPSGPMTPDQAADVALGMQLRAYAFDRYRTRRKEGEDERRASTRITVGVANVASARKAWRAREAVGGGVKIARDLVNEPPNVLFPEEFARRAAVLKELGVRVDILDERALKRLKMGALLGVSPMWRLVWW